MCPRARPPASNTPSHRNWSSRPPRPPDSRPARRSPPWYPSVTRKTPPWSASPWTGVTATNRSWTPPPKAAPPPTPTPNPASTRSGAATPTTGPGPATAPPSPSETEREEEVGRVATLEWEPLHTPRLVAFTLTGAEEGTFLLDPGTGHTRALTPGRTVVCAYPADGVYMAHVINHTDQVVDASQITICDHVTDRLRPGDHAYTVHAYYTEPGAALLEIVYADTNAPERACRTPGDAACPRWGRPGPYTATLTDVQARRSTRQDYRVTGPARPDRESVV